MFRARVVGFTLLEVMIAMAIIGLVVAQLSSAIGQSHFALNRLEEKTLAHWVAMNKMTEIQVTKARPKLGSKEDWVEMANREWKITTKVTATETKGLHLVEVSVGFRDSEGTITLLRGLKGQGWESG